VANEFVGEAVEWLIKTQNSNGSWNTYLSTAEETAYAIQALWVWNEKSASVPKSVFRQGAQWLEDHMNETYPPLWIGKCLYSPNLVIRSAIISALALAQ
jgi:hypothetical protein